MFGLLHIAESTHRVLDGKGRLWQQVQSPSGKGVHDRRQHRANLGRLGLGNGHQIDKVIVYISARVIHRVSVPDIALGQFQETSSRGQHGQALFNKAFTGQRVEDNIHPLTSGVSQDLVGKRQGARVIEVGDSQRLEHCPFARAGRGVNLSTGGLGDLDRRQPGATSRGVDQHLVAGLNVGHSMQGIVGGEEIRGNAGPLRKGQRRGQGDNQRADDGDILAKAAGHQRGHAITHLESAHTGSHLDNFPRTLTAQQRTVKGQNPQHIQHIQEVQPASMYPDFHLVGCGRAPRHRL